MKTLAITLFALAIFGLTACNQQPAVHEVLDDQESREDVYKTIVNDEDMMVEFMNVMQDNQHAMMMMQGNEHMMSGMMNRENMMEMMSVYMNDSTACEHLTDSMMVHRRTMNMMLEKMHEQGMMNQECMEETSKKVEKMTPPQYDFGNIRHWH